MDTMQEYMRWQYWHQMWCLLWADPSLFEYHMYMVTCTWLQRALVRTNETSTESRTDFGYPFPTCAKVLCLLSLIKLSTNAVLKMLALHLRYCGHPYHRQLRALNHWQMAVAFSCTSIDFGNLQEKMWTTMKWAVKKILTFHRQQSFKQDAIYKEV